MNPEDAVPGATYRHRKGGEYVLLSIAEHTETEAPMAVYRRCTDGRVYARPLELFIDGRFEALPADLDPTVDVDGILARARRGDTTPHDAIVLAKYYMTMEAQRDEARTNLAEASRAWDGPETVKFVEGVRKEAAHQVARWGVGHDAGKTAWDWFWLVGYLTQKCAASAVAGDTEKARHHAIATGAALLNWHAQLAGSASQMRPGIASPKNGGTHE